jgi:hypothetical protein
VPVVENWMLGMCDVANCINDVRDPETIRFRISKILKLKLRLSSLLLNPLTWTRAQLNGHLGKTNGELYSQGRFTPER